MELQMDTQFKTWLDQVKESLRSINMPMDDWQRTWQFDFRTQFKKGFAPADAAEAANRFWWHEQNKALKQERHKTPDCWLPRGHQGDCRPVSGANHA